MTDAHCHVTGGDPNVREILIGRDFVGIHPWETLEPGFDLEARLAEVEAAVLSPVPCDGSCAVPRGVGEIGLDRLKVREIPNAMREAFGRQLAFACDRRLPVVLHGAKCWGQVVREVEGWRLKVGGGASRFLFHGFSRSWGLLAEIVALGGFVSVGPAVLNGHAANYREAIRRIPRDRLLIETDRDGKGACPTIGEVAAGVAKVLGVTVGEVEALTDANADAFQKGVCRE